MPAVRKAPEDELIIADGFSCREQIRQNTDRYPLHLADVLNMALSGKFPKNARPEAAVVNRINSEARMGKVKAAATVVALLGTAAFGLWALFGQPSSKPKRGKMIEMAGR